MEAASHAIDVTGVSAFTVRNWASQYSWSLAPDSIGLDALDQFLSDRGKICKVAACCMMRISG